MSETTTSDITMTDPTTDLLVSEGPARRRGLRALARRRHDQRGMATAEYAVGTVAAVALVTALINVFRNKEFVQLLLDLVKTIFKAVMAAKGLGI
ncbi:DUF4244 domain-containing protein [Raineyella sp. LH-20]|uniref:DUF4244 domain-containing protein n=1 Tax=Raineyella sp. LH-20 TaxID=3081204 RepID=UPI002953A7E3|nr:DUF4244 domain-containing protein [Raineyella sp. LH-20]WOP19070.1 DUF4244 domain-containing protein [Raineyella sp. LH-20]